MKAANCVHSIAFARTNRSRVPVKGGAARKNPVAHAARVAAILRIAINVVHVPPAGRARETQAAVRDRGRTEIRAPHAERVSRGISPVNPPVTSRGRINRSRRGWATKAATTPAVVRRRNGAGRIRMPDGVRPSPAAINRVDRPAKVSINPVVLTNNSRAMTSAIARNRHRKMDGHRHVAEADRAAHQTVDFGHPKKKTRRALPQPGFYCAAELKTSRA